MIEPDAPAPTWYTPWLQQHYRLVSSRLYDKGFGYVELYHCTQVVAIEGSPFYRNEFGKIHSRYMISDQVTDLEWIFEEEPLLFYQYLEAQGYDADEVMTLGENWELGIEALLEAVDLTRRAA